MTKESDLFGFDVAADAWMVHLRRSLAPDELGSIGPYELTEEARRGGQGVVYRARQPRMQRDIAIKRLVAGVFASDSARRRFEREVAAVSMLHHPGIVTVYGMEEVDGSPVLAMEWVDGVPVTEWALREDGTRRPVDELLRLFLRICDAVRHAHANGVLHRDLKPSNILVDRSDRPRVLDFGLAKTIDDDGDVTQWTGSAGFLGTPAYASPEQIEGGGRALDVRSDVYSLGVILYELLTGGRPYAPELGMREYLDALDREAYARPSARDGRLGVEVDAIVGRALAPVAERRYPSVDALRDDVRRLVVGEPVLAHAGGRLYELRKFARRHRAMVGLGALLIAVVFASAVVTAVQAARLADERDAAAEEAARLAAVLDLLEIDLLQTGTSAPLLEAGLSASLREDVTLAEVLDAAESRVVERFSDRPTLEARVRHTLGKAYEKVGQFRLAVEQYRRVLEIVETVPGSGPLELTHIQYSLAAALTKVGQVDEAVGYYESALAGYRAAGDGTALSQCRALRGLATCAMQRGRFDDMRGCLEEGLEVAGEHFPENFREEMHYRQNLAWLDAREGERDRARATYEDLLRRCAEEFGEENENVSYLLGLLSDLDEEDGDLGAARDKSRRALAINERLYGPRHPWVAGALGDLAALLEDDVEAEAMLDRAISISVEVRGPDSVITEVHRVRLAEVFLRTERAGDALEVFDRAIPRFEAAIGPTGGATLRSRKGRGAALVALERWDGAILEYEALLELVEGVPGLTDAFRAECLAGLEISLRGVGRSAEADAARVRRDELGEKAP